MLVGNRVDSLGNRHRLPPVRRRFFNEPFHPVENFVGAVLWLNNCFPVFFADIDLCPRSNTESLSHFLREDDSPF